jgi:hypothetical protein
VDKIKTHTIKFDEDAKKSKPSYTAAEIII